MGCFGRFWGAKPTLFLVFSVALPLREDVEVFGVTPHLLNAAHDPQMDPPAAGSFVVVDAVVGDFSFDICSASTSCAIASS